MFSYSYIKSRVEFDISFIFNLRKYRCIYVQGDFESCADILTSDRTP
jgi:hypothetical protein